MNTNSEPKEKEMTFWEHVDDLRKVLIQSFIVLFGVSIVLFSFMTFLFENVILAPKSSSFMLYQWIRQCGGAQLLPQLCAPFEVEVINMNLNTPFMVHMTASFWFALVLCFPLIVYLIWRFIAPALYEHERRNASRAYWCGNVMFYLGLMVGYVLVFPLTLRFLATYQVSPNVPNMISLESYMGSFFTQIFVMGFIFETPLVCWMLSRLGLIDRHFFATYRRYAIVILLILSAVLTPSDPFSMLLMFVPLYLLYEGSALIVHKPKQVQVSSL